MPWRCGLTSDTALVEVKTVGSPPKRAGHSAADVSARAAPTTRAVDDGCARSPGPRFADAYRPGTPPQVLCLRRRRVRLAGGRVATTRRPLPAESRARAAETGVAADPNHD
jgi:hypothetical protein